MKNVRRIKQKRYKGRLKEKKNQRPEDQRGIFKEVRNGRREDGRREIDWKGKVNKCKKHKRKREN